MPTIALPVELVNRILGFLSLQRYGDVAPMIMEIQKAAAAYNATMAAPKHDGNSKGLVAE